MQVPAQWQAEGATNPRGMDPELLMAASYAADALLADLGQSGERANATALAGTLDAYL